MGCASLISLSENPALFRARNISFYYIRKTFVFKGVFEIFILLHPDAIFINIILSADHLAREHCAVSSAVVPCAVRLYPLALDQRAGHSAVIPPELAADIFDRGIVLTGGGSLISGLDALIEEKTGITTMIAEEPLTAVAIGTGKFIEFAHGGKGAEK